VIVVRYADDIVPGFQWNRTQIVSASAWENDCGSSDWIFTRIRRAESSSGGMPNRIANAEVKGNRRPATSLASRTSAGRAGRGLTLCDA